MPLVKEVIAHLQALEKPDAPCHLEYDRWISEDICVKVFLVGDVPHVHLIAVDRDKIPFDNLEGV